MFPIDRVTASNQKEMPASNAVVTSMAYTFAAKEHTDCNYHLSPWLNQNPGGHIFKLISS
jgi:hypothetical protein